MKNLMLITLLFVSTLLLFSCDKENFKEEITFELKGTWDIHTEEGNVGTITFTYDNNFRMFTDRGNVSYGDYGEDPSEEGTIVITWAEDEDGNELLTDEDYNDGGLHCIYYPLDETSCTISNLPYFKGETVTLLNKR